MGRKGNLAVFESSGISETGELYLHEYFDPILFFTIYIYIVHGLKQQS